MSLGLKKEGGALIRGGPLIGRIRYSFLSIVSYCSKITLVNSLFFIFLFLILISYLYSLFRLPSCYPQLKHVRFLDAPSQLCKRACPSVHLLDRLKVRRSVPRSVHPSAGPSLGQSRTPSFKRVRGVSDRQYWL